jgi:hypothetical protein
VARLTGDVTAMVLSGDTVPDSAIALLAPDSSGTLSNANQAVAASELLRRYHRRGRVKGTGYIGTTLVLFDSVRPEREQSGLSVPLGTLQPFTADAQITTSLGAGAQLAKAELDLRTCAGNAHGLAEGAGKHHSTADAHRPAVQYLIYSAVPVMLNPHTFPMVPYPGLAAELATRSGMGGWDAYALAVPTDRLLPFVVTRTRVPGNPSWLSCARIEHADTGAVVFTLTPTGAVTTPSGGLALSKFPDPAAGVEHFIYYGAIIPGVTLPCGVPLRLIVDDWQSPCFMPTIGLSNTHLLLEWWHSRPLSGVPYGTGLRQRFYIDNGALQFAPPRTEKETTKNPATGAVRVDFLAQYRQGTFQTEPLPAYLAEALMATEAHDTFTAGGEPWTVQQVKDQTQGVGGGRWALSMTVEHQQVLVRRGCMATVLTPEAFDSGFVAAHGGAAT